LSDFFGPLKVFKSFKQSRAIEGDGMFFAVRCLVVDIFSRQETTDVSTACWISLSIFNSGDTKIRR
jgi:hypothetical protein